jgi:hypothetical protein
MVKGLEDAINYVKGRVAVHGIVIFVKFKCDLEQRDLRLGSTERLYLLSCVVCVMHFAAVLNHAGDRQESADAFHKAVHTLECHVQNSVFHNELLLSQEALKLASLVSIP